MRNAEFDGPDFRLPTCDLGFRPKQKTINSQRETINSQRETINSQLLSAILGAELVAANEDDEAAGVPDWVVTYGDMMSLLLTFFIMLVSLSEVIADRKYRAVLNAIEQYVGYRTGPVAPPGKSFPLNSLISHLDALGSFTDDDTGFGGVKTKAIEGQDVRVFRTREGTSLPVGDPLPFSRDGVELSEKAREQLEEIAKQLAGKPNKIDIRAHTSPGGNLSDSEKRALTYERGRNVLSFLKRQGVAQERMRITAAGDTEPPRNSGEDRRGPLDRAEIRILNAFTAEYVGPRETVH